MAKLIRQSEFAQQLLSLSPHLVDSQLRRLIFEYCQRYQEVYWFEQLENTFAYLDIALGEDEFETDDWVSELASVKTEVEYAMGEYFISLSEVATALHRLLDQRAMTAGEALDVLDRVWFAHSCNEPPEDFVSREDSILCELLTLVM